MTARQACRDRLHDPALLDAGAHAGLLLSSYLQAHDDDARKCLLTAAQRACQRAQAVYAPAFERWRLLAGDGAVGAVVEVDGRTVIGLGAESPLETGLTLHHTYGTPLLPGSALKGLAAHHCDQVWGRLNPGFARTGCHYRTLFGTTEDSGHIVFFDAWSTPESLPTCLTLDVMTVHHPQYYRGLQPPTDFDDPTPITFLSVCGRFQVFARCDVSSDEGNLWAELALGLLLEALELSGLGGKTSAGYGRLRRVEGSV